MTKAIRGILAAGVLTAALHSSAAAQTLFFNGEANGVNGVSSEQNTAVAQSMIYENFVVSGGGWIITGLFGDFYSNVDWTQAAWEIRSGVSEGDGGLLLQSGTSAASHVATGGSDFGFDIYRATISGLSIFLGAGEYWFGISPIGFGTGSPDPRAFLTSTSGLNGVNPLLDNTYFFNSSTYSANFEENSEVGPANFSLGVVGPSETIPEPATLTLLATGLAGMAASRRRRKAKS